MRVKRYPLLIIAMTAGLVFFQVTGFDFLKYDDTINVSENRLILSPSLDNLFYFWRHAVHNLYIPVTYSAWAGLAYLSQLTFNGRLDPGFFHLANLIVHAVNAILVYYLIRILLALKYGDRGRIDGAWPALFGALAFCLHPVQVESVSWITGFKDLLSCFLGLSAILLYLTGLEKQGNRLIVLAAAFILYAGSVLSKPSAVAVPLILFCFILWSGKGKVFSSIRGLAPWIIMALVVIMITRHAQPVAAGKMDYPLAVRPVIFLDTVIFYLYKIAWPDILAIDYCRTPAYVLSLSWRNPAWLMLFPVAGLVYWSRNRKSWLLLAGAFVAGILPVSGLLPFEYQKASTVADRYLYLSMMVFAVVAGMMIFQRQRRSVFVLCAILVTISGVKSFYQCREWKDTASIMGHTLQHYPCSFRANLNYGIALVSRGDFERAIPYYEAARQLNPDDSLTYYNLGLAYAGMGDARLYEQHYQKLKTMDNARAARLKYAAALFESLHSSGAINGRAGAEPGEGDE